MTAIMGFVKLAQFVLSSLKMASYFDIQMGTAAAKCGNSYVFALGDKVIMMSR